MSQPAPGDVVEHEHTDHVDALDRTSRFTVGTVAPGCQNHPGPWASVWATGTFRFHDWSAELHHAGAFHGCSDCADRLPFGGHWQHADDLTVITPGHTQPHLFDLLEYTA